MPPLSASDENAEALPAALSMDDQPPDNCPKFAHLGPPAMSAFAPLSEAKQKSAPRTGPFHFASTRPSRAAFRFTRTTYHECAVTASFATLFAVHSAKISVHVPIRRKAPPLRHVYSATRVAVNSMSTVRGARRLTDALPVTPSSRPAHRGRLRRRARDGAGCGVPRAGS
jgi:hypothetical protein